MAVADWKQERLAKAWLSASGSYGDIYRQLLVNPIIHQLLEDRQLLTHSVSPLFEAYNTWYKKHQSMLSADAPVPDKWYRESARGKTSILDLGCGDAYRGRWLAKPKHTSYLGVDGSQHLLDAANPDGFDVELLNLDEHPEKVPQLWKGDIPPKWVFMVTVLDHLPDPQKLLDELASMYSSDDEGYMLVVTCNPRFYRAQPSQGKAQRVSIATLGNEGVVDVFFRSRTQMRRLFRDAGLQVVDELSPTLPRKAGQCLQHDEAAFNNSLAPLHFWLLRAQGTQRGEVKADEISSWISELKVNDVDTQATHQLLASLQPHHRDLHWRSVAAGGQVLAKLNLGGRLFVVRSGELELFKYSHPLISETEETTLRFGSNTYFGELELFVQGKERERLYSTSVYASQQPPGGAKVLEVPAAVVQKLLGDPSGLGNPMLSALRRKVLESLMTFGTRTRWSPPASIRYWSFNSDGQRGEKKPDLPKRNIVLAANLIARALEFDRERGAYDFEARRVVYVRQVSAAVNRLSNLQTENLATPLNHALEYLQGAGILRLFKATAPMPFEPAKAIIKRVEQRIGLDEYFKSIRTSRPKREFYEDLLSSAAYRMFLVEDEILLKRYCALDPADEYSRKLMMMLEQRYNLYAAQSPAVTVAKYEDLCEACLRHMKLRFDSDLWLHDSLGMPLEFGVAEAEED